MGNDFERFLLHVGCDEDVVCKGLYFVSRLSLFKKQTGGQTPQKRFVPLISGDEEFSCCWNIIRVQVGEQKIFNIDVFIFVPVLGSYSVFMEQQNRFEHLRRIIFHP